MPQVFFSIFHPFLKLTIYTQKIAQKVPSSQDLVHSLVQAGAPNDDSTQRFCSELFNRVPRKQSRTAAATIAEKQAKKKEAKEQAKLRKANEQFQLLMNEDGHEEDDDREIRKKEKKLRKKRKQDDLSDDDTEVKTTERRKRGNSTIMLKK